MGWNHINGYIGLTQDHFMGASVGSSDDFLVMGAPDVFGAQDAAVGVVRLLQ